MIHIAYLKKWLRSPSLTARQSLLCLIVAVAVPTAIRAAVHGAVTGCEFTPYLPFVLMSAILLRWWQAGAVALISVAIMGGLFVNPLNAALDTACFLSGAGIFLASSAVMIATVAVIRQAFAIVERRGADESSDGIIFSLEKNEVWASWNGTGPPVRLGSERRVSEMMKDFLAQVEIGKRFNRRSE